MLPELIVLEGVLHWLDGCVVYVQQLLHSRYRKGEREKERKRE